jgi:hypothetical protein
MFWLVLAKPFAVPYQKKIQRNLNITYKVTYDCGTDVK